MVINTKRKKKYIYIYIYTYPNAEFGYVCLGPKWIIFDVAVTWVGMIVSPLIRALEFYKKQHVGLPKAKKQKFNHP